MKNFMKLIMPAVLLITCQSCFSTRTTDTATKPGVNAAGYTTENGMPANSTSGITMDAAKAAPPAMGTANTSGPSYPDTAKTEVKKKKKNVKQ